MKGDFTRSTFEPANHYSGVRMQQGRVQLDADWNEQIDITAHRVETETVDVIGECGAPIDHAGFALLPTLDSSGQPTLAISAGRYYADGLLCENDAEGLLADQPDLPALAGQTVTPTTPGLYLSYLDVWQRHITVLEDARIREVALNGPDTATRTKTVWQVKLARLPEAETPPTCASEIEAWTNLVAAKTGRLRARAEATPPATTPCIVPPGAGFRRLENQLYRVEIHKPGGLGVATFKWSRDNGSIVTAWLDQQDDELIVSSIGRDEVLSFAPNDWVELSDDARELHGQPGTLVQLADAEGQVLTIDPNTADINTATDSLNRVDFAVNPKIRRWDSDGPQTVVLDATVNDGWLKLEEGVEIQFAPGGYQTGDYWLIPARTVTADVEWPQDGANPPQPILQPPAGIEHHYCRLAIVERTAGEFLVQQDCRFLFPPLTALTNLLYVGGDGQSAMPLFALEHPLQVRVLNGNVPVAGANVLFTLIDGGGAINVASSPLITGAGGFAECTWTLGATSAQRVEAVLLNSAGNPILGQVIHFNANLSVAGGVAYDPAACANLAGATTVQQALDILCALDRGGGCCVTVGVGGDFERLDIAIRQLLDQGERDLCLCLLPGNHEMGDPKIERSFGEPDLH
ncbi:MAG: DUF6519 domain-containing protein, partial [Chloroflexota bacterium]|nr:DUF6519 domain-containing protein [Chloroflexota bacterium]